MPKITRPDGAVIHYETFGQGYPLLLIAPGGVNSEITFWENSLINPIQEYANDFMVIGMDQRHAGESWPAPLTFSYNVATADQLAVLDDLGVERAHVWGGCIGVAYIFGLIEAAPQRISAAVGQDPVGLDDTNSVATFTDMFQPTIALAQSDGMNAVVQAAIEDPLFVFHNEAGPFARQIVGDPEFRATVTAMNVDQYVSTVREFGDLQWPDSPPYFNVTDEWLRACRTPLLIMPGSDEFHPTKISHMICEAVPSAHCLEVDCRSDEKRAATIEDARAFLKKQTPA